MRNPLSVFFGTKVYRSGWGYDDVARVKKTNPHQLLLEVTMGEWVDATPAARAELTLKLMEYLNVDFTQHTGSTAHEWLKSKERARERAG